MSNMVGSTSPNDPNPMTTKQQADKFYMYIPSRFSRLVSASPNNVAHGRGFAAALALGAAVSWLVHKLNTGQIIYFLGSKHGYSVYVHGRVVSTYIHEIFSLLIYLFRTGQSTRISKTRLFLQLNVIQSIFSGRFTTLRVYLKIRLRWK